MKTISVSPILVTAIAPALGGMAILAPIHQAQAGKKGTASGASGVKTHNTHPRDSVSKLTCVASGWPIRHGENKATSMRTNKDSSPIIRDRGEPDNDSSPVGGVKVGAGKPRPSPRCAGWGC